MFVLIATEKALASHENVHPGRQKQLRSKYGVMKSSAQDERLAAAHRLNQDSRRLLTRIDRSWTAAEFEFVILRASLWPVDASQKKRPKN